MTADAAYAELLSRFGHVGNAADVAHAVLRHSIVHNVLPPGTRFRAEDLARKFGMSRTPVREAQLRLEAEGLLEVKPGVGLIVREFSTEQVLEIYDIREALEGMAAGLAAENATSRERATLADILADMRAQADTNFALLRELSGEFHLAVAQASHNLSLTAMIKDLQDKFRRFQPSTLTNSARASEAIAELAGIQAAIEARDVLRAEAAARAHRRRTRDLYMEASRQSARPKASASIEALR
jgi:DNA-binding GntR family transcriptional regulator